MGELHSHHRKPTKVDRGFGSLVIELPDPAEGGLVVQGVIRVGSPKSLLLLRTQLSLLFAFLLLLLRELLRPCFILAYREDVIMPIGCFTPPRIQNGPILNPRRRKNERLGDVASLELWQLLPAKGPAQPEQSLDCLTCKELLCPRLICRLRLQALRLEI